MIKPWETYVKPFRITENLCYVGTKAAASHLIDTGKGLILIDSGFPQTLYLVIDGIYSLGYDPRDIKYIFHTHGHYDHIGGTRALVGLTGARTFIGSGDKDYVSGKYDLTWARELGYTFTEAFEADSIINDGDVIRLGDTEITCLATPGHTPGTIS